MICTVGTRVLVLQIIPFGKEPSVRVGMRNPRIEFQTVCHKFVCKGAAAAAAGILVGGGLVFLFPLCLN
jgi:hypothetical protein